ncbi:MAG: sulfur oxidation c-type cytochrome SoxX [Pseudomonadota bacterium]
MKRTPIALGAALLGAWFLTATPVLAQEAKKEETGKDIAFNRSKGNCLACHAMPTVPDAEQPGNSGPPLIAMKDRYPDKAKLRAKIANPMADNPITFMPVFGKHKILSDQELDKVVDYIYSL